MTIGADFILSIGAVNLLTFCALVLAITGRSGDG